MECFAIDDDWVAKDLVGLSHPLLALLHGYSCSAREAIVRAGHVVSRPAGTGVSHVFRAPPRREKSARRGKAGAACDTRN